jgi:hypothetical protein
MKQVTLDEILGLERYEQVRDAFRRRIIALKKERRVALGDRVTFVFENHDTMLFQIQEMVRAEHITDLDKIRDEIAVFNVLVPDGHEFSTTMLIEITDSDRIREDLIQFMGVDEAVRLEIGDPAHGGFSIPGQFEAGRSKEDKLSAVQYVRFPLQATAREAFIDGRQPVRLVIDHPNYHHAAAIEGAVRRSLAQDLEVA